MITPREVREKHDRELERIRRALRERVKSFLREWPLAARRSARSLQVDGASQRFVPEVIAEMSEAGWRAEWHEARGCIVVQPPIERADG